MDNSKMPMRWAIMWILVSTLFISGSAFMGWLYYLHVRERRLHDDQYRIVAMMQSTPQADALKSIYLAELLNLSLDRPINLYQFNAKEAAQSLLNHPLIKAAAIKKILPGSLYIHYEMRTPFAYIGDFANTVIDEEGYLFPFHPFFTPKRLPIVYLDLGSEKEEYKWGSCLKNLSSVQLAFDFLYQFEQLQQDQFYLKQLDVAQAQADSYGQRQIVIVLEGTGQNLSQPSQQKPLIFLRLSCDKTMQGLANFQTLQRALSDKKGDFMANERKENMIFDLRILHLAFIKSGHYDRNQFK
jgi:hypothetical protein